MIRKDQRISHLSDDQIDELVYAYTKTEEKNSDLVTRFNIKIHPSHLFRMLPPVERPDILCKYCRITLWQYLKPRTVQFEINYPFCKICNHRGEIGFCNCIGCQRERNESEIIQQSEKIEKIKSAIDLEKTKRLEIKNLNVRELVYLAAVLMVGQRKNSLTIKPLQEWTELLSPTIDFDYEIIRFLLKNQILIVHPYSPYEAFEFEGEKIHYELEKISFFINLAVKGINENELLDLVFEIIETEIANEDIVFLCEKVNLEECKQYYLYSINKVGFIKKELGIRVDTIFKSLLEKFSVSEIYHIIWRERRSASEYFLEKKISKEHAANLILSNSLVYTGKSRVVKWDPKPFDRQKECQQSILSIILFNKILKIGDIGFNTATRIYVNNLINA